MKWRERGGVRWLEAELPGARAAFTARVGGVSSAPFASLNLGLLTGDDRFAVRENRRRCAGAVGIDPTKVLIARQVHAAEVARRDVPQPENAFAAPGPRIGEADGHATAAPGLAPLVFVADCLPVALTGPGGVAMIHCGWRGLAAGIVARGVEETNAVAAAIGPGIGACHYEVGADVLAAFADLGDGIAAGRRLDLVAVAMRLLARAGVEQVESAAICTHCESELFFSHRRDRGRTGRQAGMVWACPA